jgi:hypothetical protein
MDTLKEYLRRHPEKADEIISKLKSYNLLNENGAPRFGDNSIYRNQCEEILKAINDKDICWTTEGKDGSPSLFYIAYDETKEGKLIIVARLK